MKRHVATQILSKKNKTKQNKTKTLKGDEYEVAALLVFILD
jgi:hypothetical protein